METIQLMQQSVAQLQDIHLVIGALVIGVFLFLTRRRKAPRCIMDSSHLMTGWWASTSKKKNRRVSS